MSLNIQFITLINTIILGIFFGFTLETLAHFTSKMKHKFSRDLLFVLFWTVQIPITILFFHRINQGQFQSYLLIFVLFGGLIYSKLLRTRYLADLKIVHEVSHQLLKWIKKLINVLILTPLHFIFSVIHDIIVLPKRFYVRFLRKKRNDDETDDEELDGDGEI